MSETPETNPTPPPAKRLPWAALGVALALMLLTGWTYRALPTYGLLGLDTLLQIDAGRIESWADFQGTFTETLTDGVIKGKFYRPVQNLSIALDYALWGLDPRGYQWQSLLSLCATIGLFFWVTHRWSGGGWLGPIVTALFFALHPVLLNALPTPCRRSEVLVILFLLGALAILPLYQQRRSVLRSWAAGFLVLLACGAKDIGIMGLGLVFLHQLLLMPRPTVFKTVGRATLMTLPTLLAVILYFVNRTLVLDGLGGYPQAAENPLSPWERLTQYGQATLAADLAPFLPVAWQQAGWTPMAVGPWLFVLLLVTSILAIGILLRRPYEERRLAAPLVLGLAWLVPPFILLGALHENWAWYGVLPAGGFALIAGGLVQVGAVGMTRGPRWRVILGVPGLLVLVSATYSSPLWTDYPDMREATQLLDDVWEQVDTRVPKAKPGRQIPIVTQPYYKGPWPENRPVLGATSTVMGPGIQAYARLKYPEKNATVLGREPLPGSRPVRLRITFSIHPRTRSIPDGPPPWAPKRKSR